MPIEVGGLDISFTNSAAFMVAGVVVVTAFLTLSMRGGRLVPSRWQSMAELSYEFIAGMVRDNVGREGRQYFPFIFTLFMFILAGNLLGMIPYAYTFTSQIIVTFGLAFVVLSGSPSSAWWLALISSRISSPTARLCGWRHCWSRSR